jgi:hypothetical protein
MAEQITNTTVLTQGALDGVLAAAKANEKLAESFPQLANIRSVKLESAVGVRVELDAPVIGHVEAVVRLEVRDGAAFPGSGSGS